MKVRSPVLGYNHNVRYAGRLWHVQTEDSGVHNPHLFTHLFHDGTILATKRLDYDPATELTAVQKLMQAQHKAMLRELKAGVFDEKIGKFFGEPVVRQSEEESTDPNAKPPLEMQLEVEESVSLDDLPVLPLAGARTERETPVPPPTGRLAQVPPQPPRAAPSTRPQVPAPSSSLPASPPSPPQTGSVGRATTVPALERPQIPRPPAPPPSSAHAPRMPAAGLGGRRPPATGHPPAYASKPSAEGVVVTRPAVIIGGEGTTPGAPRSAPRRPQTARPSPPSSTRWQSPAPQLATPAAGAAPAKANPVKSDAPAPASPPGGSDSIFGGDLISEKSLDEVILAYLSEDLNEK